MSEQSFKLASWNIRDGLSDPTIVKDVVENIRAIDADIVALPEAYHEEASQQPEGQKAYTLAQAAWDLVCEGYNFNRVLYADTDGRRDRHGFVLLTRFDTKENPVSTISLGSRQAALRQQVAEFAVDVTGIHLDDRSESRRQNQTVQLLHRLAGNRSVITGDLNSMHYWDAWARRLRLIRPIVPRVQRPAEIESAKDKILWKASLASRLTDMADGGTMDLFASGGYIDVDDKHQATKGPVQLDHILTNLRSRDDIFVDDYKVENSTPGTSDHKPISAVVSR